MTQFQFKKAERTGIFSRIAIDGITGGGKTGTAIQIARGLQGNKRIAFIDTENDTALRYVPLPGQAADPDNFTFDFDHLSLKTHEPDTYVEALKAVDPSTYSVTIVDSLSHAWTGRGGALEQVDRAAARSSSANKFAAWRDVTPMHNRLVDALLSHQTHLIVTMRSKMAYELVEDDRGKKVPKRLGLAPVQREGIEYEFDIMGDMTNENGLVRLSITKTRASFLNGALFDKPGPEIGRRILEWCGEVEPQEPKVSVEWRKALGAGKTPEQQAAVVKAAKDLFGCEVKELTVSQGSELERHLAAAEAA